MHEPDENQGPVIRDKRRIDPLTGEVREPRDGAAPASSAAPSGAPETAAPPSDAEAQLAERTADLQRLQAEYINYKRRVDRDRETTRQSAVASVLIALLPVLDDIGRAREHEELTGGFKAVAESLERTVSALGLVPFGQVGDAFDPRIHEALMHTYDDDVNGAVCRTIFDVGYRLGERIIRPARVAVAEGSAVPEPADISHPSGGADAAGATKPADEAEPADEAGAPHLPETPDPQGVDDPNVEVLAADSTTK